MDYKERLGRLMEEWDESFSTNEKARLCMKVQFAFNNWMAYLLQYLNKQQMLNLESEVEVEKKGLVGAASRRGNLQRYR